MRLVFIITTLLLTAGCSQNGSGRDSMTSPTAREVVSMVSEYNSAASINYDHNAGLEGQGLSKVVNLQQWNKIKTHALRSNPIELEATLVLVGKIVFTMKTGQTRTIFVYQDSNRQIWSPKWVRNLEVNRPVYFATQDNERIIDH